MERAPLLAPALVRFDMIEIARAATTSVVVVVLTMLLSTQAMRWATALELQVPVGSKGAKISSLGSACDE